VDAVSIKVVFAGMFWASTGIVRCDIGRERPHLSFVAPPYKPVASAVELSEPYWQLMCDVEAGVASAPRRGLIARVLRRFGYAKME